MKHKHTLRMTLCFLWNFPEIQVYTNGGDMAQEVRAVVWQSEGCQFDPTLGVSVSLSKTPNPQLLLTNWLVPCMAANRCWCVSGSINCTAHWIKALYKCSPFTDTLHTCCVCVRVCVCVCASHYGIGVIDPGCWHIGDKLI